MFPLSPSTYQYKYKEFNTKIEIRPKGSLSSLFNILESVNYTAFPKTIEPTYSTIRRSIAGKIASGRTKQRDDLLSAETITLRGAISLGNNSVLCEINERGYRESASGTGFQNSAHFLLGSVINFH